jgi:phosphate transport system substrate-binding protein
VSRTRTRVVALVAALALFATMPAAAAQAKKIITISGSTSVFPLETQLARKWIKTKQGKKYGFKILQGGSNVGVSDVSKGRVSIGASSRDPAAGDPGGLVFTRIARDAICIVTNPSNHLSNISFSTIQGIFAAGGSIATWGSVPGASISGAIDPIGRAPTSGTHDAFRDLFLRTNGGAANTNQGTQVQGLASNGLVQQGVKTDTQGIGYVSLAFVSGLNVAAVGGVDCTLRNAQSFQYPGVRSFYFVTLGAPAGGVKQFIKWTLKSKQANKIVGSEWIPLH